MKKNIFILLVAVAFLGSSCENFLSVNEENPNSASKVAPKLVIPGAINDVSNIMNNPRNFDFVYLWHGLWSISAGYSQPQALVQYKLLNQNYQGIFNTSFTTAQNFVNIEKTVTDPKDVYYVAMAKIMKAYIFQNLVDCYGDVPYSEAFKAPANLKPSYDPQKTIYEDLIVQLDAAIKLIQDAPVDATSITSSCDIVFKGDMNKWLKFANTLKLRILLHQSGMADRKTYILDNIKSTESIGYLGVGESALTQPGYLSSEGQMNIFYETFYKADGSTQSDGVTYYFAGKDVVDFMKATGDPRIAKFFQPYSGTSYEGNVFGRLPADLTAASSTSKLGYAKDDAGCMIGTATKPQPLLTDFESLFIQAEAAERGLITGNAKALYESAVAQSFVYMGLNTGLASKYIAQGFVTVDYEAAAASKKLDLILTQKWVALNGIAPVEIWTDYRRTGSPTFLHFSVDPAKAGPGTPPVRLLYPQSEITVNNDNLLKVGDIDLFTSKIFWQNR